MGAWEVMPAYALNNVKNNHECEIFASSRSLSGINCNDEIRPGMGSARTKGGELTLLTGFVGSLCGGFCGLCGIFGLEFLLREVLRGRLGFLLLRLERCRGRPALEALSSGCILD